MKTVSMKKRMLSIIVTGTLCFSMCSCGSESTKATKATETTESTEAPEAPKTTVDDVVNQIANVIQSENENVLAVKGGTNSNYSGVTYGEAFEAFFGQPTWKYYKGTQEGPDEDGDGEPDYTIDNIDVVEFTGTCTYQEVKVKALIQFTLDNEAGTFDATYLSFNEVPQSTLMLSGLLNKVFESYLENKNGASTEKTLETETHMEESEPKDNSTDTDFAYDYEAMSYAGSYSGCGGYSISFSPYSSVEDDEIGFVEIYYNGDLVSSRSVYLCTDRGDWSDWNYDQFYVMHVDGYNEYLGFYESEGSLWVDYNGSDKNYDSLEMTERYES